MKLYASGVFLYPKEDYKTLAKAIRLNKIDFIYNNAAHYWTNTDAMKRFQESKELTSILIKDLEKELELK